MEKFRTVFVWFIILWLATALFLDIKIEQHSVYWLAFKLFGYLATVVTSVFISIRERENFKWANFFFNFFWILLIGYWGYEDIGKYKNNVCFDKFGPEFNQMRRIRGVPAIPTDWHEAEHFNNSPVTWEKKDRGIGHQSKGISVDSTCAVTFEHDGYYLKSVNGKSRNLTIWTKYARGKGKDFITFSYYDGDSTREISKLKAESILAAEKIKKDY